MTITIKKTKKQSLEQRIYALEKLFKTPEGTMICRTLRMDKGTMWSIGFGQIMAPKTFFTGSTIDEALTEVEKAVADKNFINDPWERLERNVEKQKL